MSAPEAGKFMNVDSLLCCVSLATMSTNVSTVSPVDVHSWRRERRGRSDRPGGRNKPHTQGLLHAFTDFRSRFGNVSLRSSRCLWTALYQHFNFVQESQNLIENHTKTHRKQAFIRSRGDAQSGNPSRPAACVIKLRTWMQKQMKHEQHLSIFKRLLQIILWKREWWSEGII